jgi:CrcB protein
MMLALGSGRNGVRVRPVRHRDTTIARPCSAICSSHCSAGWGRSTFSTFTYETVRLADDSAYALALLNVVGMTTLGLAAAAAGLLLGRAL